MSKKTNAGSEVPTQKRRLPTQASHIPDKATREQHIQIAMDLSGYILDSCGEWLRNNHPELEDRYGASICSLMFMKCMAALAAQWLNIDQVDEYVEHNRNALKENILNSMEALAAEEPDVQG